MKCSRRIVIPLQLLWKSKDRRNRTITEREWTIKYFLFQIAFQSTCIIWQMFCMENHLYNISLICNYLLWWSEFDHECPRNVFVNISIFYQITSISLHFKYVLGCFSKINFVFNSNFAMFWFLVFNWFNFGIQKTRQRMSWSRRMWMFVCPFVQQCEWRHTIIFYNVYNHRINFLRDHCIPIKYGGKYLIRRRRTGSIIRQTPHDNKQRNNQ